VATAFSKYKYNPQDFVNMPSLSEDLSDFYHSYEQSNLLKTIDTRLELERLGRVLFFTVKHRVVEGRLTPMQAEEIYDYLEGLLND